MNWHVFWWTLTGILVFGVWASIIIAIGTFGDKLRSGTYKYYLPRKWAWLIPTAMLIWISIGASVLAGLLL